MASVKVVAVHRTAMATEVSRLYLIVMSSEVETSLDISVVNTTGQHQETTRPASAPIMSPFFSLPQSDMVPLLQSD